MICLNISEALVHFKSATSYLSVGFPHKMLFSLAIAFVLNNNFLWQILKINFLQKVSCSFGEFYFKYSYLSVADIAVSQSMVVLWNDLKHFKLPCS